MKEAKYIPVHAADCNCELQQKYSKTVLMRNRLFGLKLNVTENPLDLRYKIEDGELSIHLSTTDDIYPIFGIGVEHFRIDANSRIIAIEEPSTIEGFVEVSFLVHPDDQSSVLPGSEEPAELEVAEDGFNQTQILQLAAVMKDIIIPLMNQNNMVKQEAPSLPETIREFKSRVNNALDDLDDVLEYHYQHEMRARRNMPSRGSSRGDYRTRGRHEMIG